MRRGRCFTGRLAAFEFIANPFSMTESASGSSKLIAVVFALAMLPPASAADKNKAAVAPSQFGPAAPGSDLFDPALLNFSDAVTNYDARKFNTDKFQTDSPGVKLPTTIDLGKSMLRFDTSRNPGTRVGIDEKDPALLNPGIPVRKDSPLTPSYFGLTITAPIR
jgi:hypothetical protein